MALHVTLDTIIRKAERMRVTLPRAPLSTYQRMLDTLAGAEQDADDRGAVRHAITTAAVAGEDVAAVSGAKAAVADVKVGLKAAADQLLAEHAEDLFAAFTPRFDEAATMLVRSVAALPRVFNLDQPTMPNRRSGPQPLAAQGEEWQQARYADQVLVEVELLWKILAMSSARFPIPGKQGVLVLAEVPAELWLEMRAAEVAKGKLRPWNYAQMGVTFSLASPAMFRQRRSALVAELQALDAQATNPPKRMSATPADDPLAYVP